MVRVRKAELNDAERLLEIYAYYVENTAVTFEYEVPSLDEFRGRMKVIMEAYPYLVIEQDGEVCGYAYAGTFKDRAAYDWACEITIYLDRDARRNGLGKTLYEALFKTLGQMGICNLYACIAETDSEDPYLTDASEIFHGQLGFARVGTFRQCGYKFGRWYNMIWMEKIIGSHETEQMPVNHCWTLLEG